MFFVVYYENHRKMNNMGKKIVNVDELPQELRGKGKIISMMNNKGGCGKTTTAISFGLYLARTGHNVLFADCDPQHNLTQRLGIDEDMEMPRLGNLFVNSTPSIENDISRIMEYPGLQRLKGTSVSKGIIGLLPGSLDAEAAAKFMNVSLGMKSRSEKEKIGFQSMEHFFRSYLQSYLDYYEYIIVDTAPALEGNELNTAIAKSIDCAIIPIDGIEAAIGVRRLTSFLSSHNPLRKPNAFFAMVKYQQDLKTDLSKDLRSRNSVYRGMTDVFNGYVCSKGVQERKTLRVRNQGSKNNLPGFGGSTDYTEMSHELESLLKTNNRVSLLDYIEKDPNVMRGFEERISKLMNSAMKHKPLNKTPRYIDEEIGT